MVDLESISGDEVINLNGVGSLDKSQSELACHCEILDSSTLSKIPELETPTSSTLWMACKRLGEWVYGWCVCASKTTNLIPDSGVTNEINDPSTMNLSLLPAGSTRSISRLVRLSKSSTMELLDPTSFFHGHEPIPVLKDDGDFWVMQKAACTEFARLVNCRISTPETTHDDSWEVVTFHTQSGDGRLHSLEEPKVAISRSKRRRMKKRELRLNSETNAEVINECPDMTLAIQQTRAITNRLRPVDDSELGGRQPQWLDSVTRKTLVRRLRKKGLSKADREAIDKRLMDLGVRDPNPPMPGERFRYTVPESKAASYRPRTISAQCSGRVHKVFCGILIDSGSSISVVSRRFAEKHLRECLKVAYSGNEVTVANADRIMPEGIIHTEIEIGGDRRIVPLVVFAELPVDILLGTDWLYMARAITDWGNQRLRFGASKGSVRINILAEHQPSELHTTAMVIIPPHSGRWVSGKAPKRCSYAKIPLATVMTTSDPWCARHRGVITQQAITNARNGRCDVFLVNTSSRSVRIKKGNTIAWILPDVPPTDQLVALDDPVFELNSSLGGVDPTVVELKDRLMAISTMSGVDSSNMSLTELSNLVAQVTELDSCWYSSDKNAREGPATYAPGLGTFNGCMTISLDEQLKPTRVRDEFVSEVYTSRSIIGKIRSYFGDSIGLDPASCKRANDVVRATQYFTKEMDGLKLNWDSNKIFINPPFAEMKEWAPKIIHEASVLHDGREKEVFVLVPYREATWLTQLLSKARLALLPTKKPTFWSDRKDHLTIRDPIVLLYFGPESKIDTLTSHFRTDFTAVRPMLGKRVGSTYTPLDASNEVVVDDDYDPVPEVSIGDKRDLTPEQRSRLESLIREYRQVINQKIGLCRVAGARIDTGNHHPVNLPLRRISPAQRLEVEKQIKQLLDLNIIRPSQSPWAAGIVLAPKPDGSWRFCVDYRELNNRTTKDSYPLPRVDDYLHALEQNRWFSLMDLTSGFWQIPMHEEDAAKTAFLSHVGLFEWTRMPMGPCNSPAVFQRVMDLAFGGMKWRNLLVYMDDILVMSPTFEDHLNDLRETFTRLKDLGMTVKPSKCHFACGEIKYLGHLITEQGIRVNPEKTKAITEMEWPNSSDNMKSFLGLVSYYRDFIHRCSTICEPLRLLTLQPPADYPLSPNEKQLSAFNALKQALTKEDAVLMKPDFSKRFYLQTDASKVGLGAVLSQKDDQGKDRVISYASRTLQKAERPWHSHELEALAAIWACELFRPYLVGREFTLQTDNSAVKWLLAQTKPGRLQRWILRIQEFQFTTEHRPGTENGNADGPSRNPVPYSPADEEMLSELALGLPLEPFSLVALCTMASTQGECRSSIRNLMSTLRERDRVWRKLSQEKRLRMAQQFTNFVLYLDDNPTSTNTSQPFMLESSIFRDAFIAAQRRDPDCSKIIRLLGDDLQGKDLKKSLNIKSRYCLLDDGLLVRPMRWRLFGPAKALAIVPKEYRDELLRLYHDVPHGGHLGGNKMYSRIRDSFYWNEMSRDCKHYSRACKMCNSRKPPKKYTSGKMVIRERAGNPWERLSIDLLSGFVKSKRGNTLCLVVTDDFTKGVEVIPLRNSKAETIARALVTHVFYRHGIPKRIHADQGSNLTVSLVLQAVTNLLGISRSFSSPAHPQGNGQVERFNRFLVESLYCLMNRKQDDWDDMLPPLLFAYHTSLHPTTGESPFFLMHGRDAVLPGDLLLSRLEQDKVKGNHREYAQQLHADLKDAFETVCEKQRLEEERQKRYHDEHYRKTDVSFSAGDEIQPADVVVIHYQEPHVIGNSTKFRSTWSVPFRVIRKLPNGVNYEVANVRNPDSKRIVHVSSMRRYYPWTGYSDSVPPEHIDLTKPFPGHIAKKTDLPVISHSEDFLIDDILDQYSEGRGKLKKTWYLVHWHGYAPEEVSWVKSDDVSSADIVKAWRTKVKSYTATRKALIRIQPSKRPLQYRWDDPSDLNTSIGPSDDDSSNDEDDVTAKATTPELDIEMPNVDSQCSRYPKRSRS